MIYKRFLIILFFCSSLLAQNNDYLFLKYKNNSDSCGYVNIKGEVIIPFGKYPVCFTDTLKNFAVVYAKGKGFIGIDRNENILFNVYEIDNGPDYPSEGAFRIKENNKVGFADKTGKIIIKPAYDDALPFSEGLAGVCSGCTFKPEGEYKLRVDGKWGFINKNNKMVIKYKYDKIIKGFLNGIAEVEINSRTIMINKKGDEIKSEEMKTDKWLKIFNDAIRLLLKEKFNNELTTEFREINSNNYWNFSGHKLIPVEINVKVKDSNKIIDQYLIVPWQNFQKIKSSNSSVFYYYDLITVNDFAVVFSEGPTTLKTKDEKVLDDKFLDEFRKLIDFENNQMADNDTKILIPEDLQIIFIRPFMHYVDIQIALPGSRIPTDEELSKSVINKMIRLQIIPEVGEIKTRWIKPLETGSNPYYTSVEDDLLCLFTNAINQVIDKPVKKREIFEDSKRTLRGLFNAANSYVNYLYNKYEDRLSRWLQLKNQITELPYTENLFPDYVPKRTPDTAIDYMPLLENEFELIPEASAENILELINLFTKEKKKAEENPGKWIEGNPLLGAREKEYKPSKDELITAEIGDRIKFILNRDDREKALTLIKSSDITENRIDYKKFYFIHYDVMGSGRFFYVDRTEDVSLKLK